MQLSFSNIDLRTLVLASLLFGFPKACFSERTSLIDSLNAQQNTYVTIKAQNPTANWEHNGAGVIINPQGWIATNAHIIWQAERIKVIFNDGQESEARLQKVFKDLDLSFLKIRPKPTLKSIDWADSDRVNFGDDVVAIGHSKLLKDTLSGGKIVGLAKNTLPGQPHISIIETNMNMYKGDSGGPVFDNEGKFLGLIVGKQKQTSESVFIIPSNVIRMHFINAHKEKHP